MIAAILSALILPAQEVVPELELVEVWSTTLPAGTSVNLLEDALIVEGKAVHPSDGSVISAPEHSFVMPDKPQPDFIKDDMGYVLFHRGDQFDFAFVGDYHEEGYLGRLQRMVKLKAGSEEFTDEASASAETQPLFRTMPIYISQRLRQGYWFVESFPAYEERDSRYHGIILDNPLRVSPLQFTLYHDLTVPERALGVYQINFFDYMRTYYTYIVKESPIACGNIYTGHVHWKLDDDISWAQRIGDFIIAYDRQNREWLIVNEDSGETSPLGVPQLENRSPGSGLRVIDGLLVIKEIDDVKVKVTSYSAQ